MKSYSSARSNNYSKGFKSLCNSVCVCVGVVCVGGRVCSRILTEGLWK